MSERELKFKRVLLKLSGETFGGSEGKGLDTTAFEKLALYLSTLHKQTRIELAIVVGAGNLFRGRNVRNTHFDRELQITLVCLVLL